MTEFKKYELLPEHEALIPEHTQKWVEIATSTKQMDENDKQIVRENVDKLYRASDAEPPKKIIFVDSPFIVRFATGLASAISARLAEGKKLKINKKKLLELCENNIHANLTMRAVKEATDIDLPELPEVKNRNLNAVYAEKDLYYFGEGGIERPFVLNNCVKLLDPILGLQGEGVNHSKDVYDYYWQGGNQWAWTDCFITFFRYIAGFEKEGRIDYTAWDPWEKLTIHSGPRVVREDFCMVSDRPEVLLLDSQSRPHNPNGPFVRWRDGTSLYYVNGVSVPAWIVEDKGRITPQMIEKETNGEVRRVMLEFYGFTNYLMAGPEEGCQPFEILDEDYDQFGEPRQLLRKKLPDDEDLLVCTVVNSTPEPDGTKKKYMQMVHPECRPLIDIENRVFGEPQALTCHNAIASTFGERGEDYGKNGSMRQGDVYIKYLEGGDNLPFMES